MGNINDDKATIAKEMIADNDTQSPRYAITAKTKMIGQLPTAIAEHSPALGHIIKDTNIFLCTQNKNPSLKEDTFFKNENLKSIHTYIHALGIKNHLFIELQSKKKNVCTNSIPSFNIIVGTIQIAFKKTRIGQKKIYEEAASNTLRYEGGQ